MTSNNTDNIISELEKLDRPSGGIPEDNPEANPKANPQSTSLKSDIESENKTICRLLNVHLREFFDDIYIPFKYFRDDDWNVSKVLYNNEDILFYNENYVTPEDEQKFYQVFERFITMLEDIFTPTNKLYIFLKNWTDMSGSRWKPNSNKSYLKSILTNKKYQHISPSHTVTVYLQYSKLFNGDIEKVKDALEKYLDNLVAKIRKQVKIFKKQYNELVSIYVYEYPLELHQQKNYYVMGFINSVILAILDFANKLMDLNVYAIHPIITNIIEYYTPLDEITHYDPSDNDDRDICII